jgi:monoamine oxidase
MNKENILIIGGGLTGLTLAYLLNKRGQRVTILEAKNRLGGRIYTTPVDKGTPIDMGATWLGKKHEYLVRLLDELNIEIFEQRLGQQAIYEPISTSPPQLVQLPPNDAPSFRLKGGTYVVIEELAKRLMSSKSANIYLDTMVSQIALTDDQQIRVKTGNEHLSFDRVVSTLPPNLFVSTIACQPTLPEELINIAQQTHTWMGESIKIGFRYKQPFWRAKHLSGTIFSNVGPISELYDHSNFEDTRYALKGFMNGAYHTTSKEERKAVLLNQLRRYFGDKADQYESYEETVWRHEPTTFIDYNTNILPHQNNGNAIFRKPYWDGKLLIGGSETADQFPGYMDGAVRSAYFIADSLLNGSNLKKPAHIF